MSATQSQGGVPPPVFHGRLSAFNKPKLQDICLALGFSQTEIKKNKDVLTGYITAALDKDASLAKDHRFVGLILDPKPAKPAKRSSATKTADDAAANASKAADALTGANLTLHTKKITTDPAPKFAALGLKSGNKPPKKGPQGKPKDDGSSSLSSVSSAYPASDKEDEKAKSDVGEEEDAMDNIPPPPPHTPSPRPVPGGGGGPKTPLVLVSFKHPTQLNMPGEQVYVHNAKVITSTSPGGSNKHEVELTDLIPKALANTSPIKADRAGRISRPGIFKTEDIMGVGNVQQHLDGTSVPANLLYGRANRMELTDHGDAFRINLYYQPSMMAPVPSAPNHNLTGANTDKPLEIARARGAQGSNSGSKKPKEAQVLLNTDSFNKFLTEFADYTVKARATNNFGGQCLDAFLDYKPYQDKFGVFSKPGGGYYIAPDYKPDDTVAAQLSPGWEAFLNGTFTQDEVTKASGHKRTSTRNNVTMFRRIKLLGGDLYDWMKAPRPSADASSDDEPEFTYETMSQKELTKLVDALWKEHKAQKPQPYKKSASSESKSTKNAKVSGSRSSKHKNGGEEDTEGRKKKRQRSEEDAEGEAKKKKSKAKRGDEGEGSSKGKGKGRAAMDSDNMDDI
ncbi:hypothetical protein DFH06DRAFT_1350677 [Mycena polygramma]|nr:hypothetical protein DFH06DRAFT_1350677 [Mycena polygramma]